MKICFVLEHFHPHVGGVETEFWEFSTRLAARGHRIEVLTSDSGGIAGRRTYDALGVTYHPWRSFFGHPIPRARDLDDSVREAEIVHTTTYTAAIPALRAARKAGKPCLLTTQEVLGRRWGWVEPNPVKRSLFRTFERWVVSRRYDRWHAISHATALDVVALGIPSSLVHPIHLGVDNEFWSPSHPALDTAALFGFGAEDKLFLFFGRPGQTKGTTVLLDAIDAVRDRLPKDAKFGFILGAHPPGEREKFRAAIENRRLAAVARIVPSVPRDQLRGYIRGAYAAVVPSVTEGFGFSAAETCALGTPLVASNAGSLPEVVSGRHLVFENRNARDLGEKLLLACQGMFSSKPRAVFSWERAVDRLEDLYAAMSGAALETARAPVSENRRQNGTL